MIDKPFYFGGQTPTEILVHEAGHNAAAIFKHTYTLEGLKNSAKDGYYEYNQTGLQSNQNGKIYPTMKNTLAIINDEQNRENMKIL